MEISSFNGLADLGMEDPLFMHQWPHVDSTFLEDYDNDFHQNQYSDNNNYDHHGQLLLDFQRGAIDGHSRIWDSSKPENTGSPHPNTLYSSPRTKEEEAWCNINSLNFSSSPLDHSTNYVLKSCRGAKTVISTLSNNNNNVLAERKRRVKLSQKFIALSTLVPGLKKMDKATVLGDAINHIKQLQHRVKALEDRTRRTKMESFVFVKKHIVHADNNSENSSSYADDQINISSGPITTESPLPEIEARFCHRDVLISIHCEKRKGVLENTVAEIENLHLSVVNSSVMSFGDSSINITLVARKDEEFNVNIKELVPNIRRALKKFM